MVSMDALGRVDGGIVVSGSRGRLGRALATAAAGAVRGWDRPLFDLDERTGLIALVARDRPGLVIHTAAMTDVDGAALDPDTAMRRNGDAVGVLAQACREMGAGFVLLSSNEVFDGERSDGRGYAEDDTTTPRNPYGRSKLAGEQAARSAYDGHEGLWIIRTAWLYGPPGGDFIDKITAAADRLGDTPLPVVADEFGSPTATPDLARAIYGLIERTPGGTFHLVNSGVASRLDWARAVLEVRRPGREIRAITLADYQRRSDPPRWGVVDTTRAAAAGVSMRPWQEALSEYLAR